MIAGTSALVSRLGSRRLPDVIRRYCWNHEVRRILERSDRLQGAAHDDLRRQASDLRAEIESGADLPPLVIPVFSLVREFSRRLLGMAHHPVQILGALAMFRGSIAEMQTGEGKTLTALMPLVIRAMQGRGAHVITANDYLAVRDAAFAAPVLKAFGLSVDSVSHDKSTELRTQAYLADVTYGTEKQFGFDFLIDTMTVTTAYGTALERREANACPGLLQRGHHFALIDEADSILIDQASTPLIISSPQPCPADEQVLYRWCDALAARLVPDRHYRLYPRKRSAKLTEAGCRAVLLTGRPPQLGRFPMDRLYFQVERSLVAQGCYRGERDYLVIDGKVEIVDEGTGRVLHGRKWQDGLQQAVEVQAGVAFSDSMGTAARITLQSYMKKYASLCGMSGTATDVRQELRDVYAVQVNVVPPHRPCRRVELPPRVFATLDGKMDAIATEIERLVAAGRAILVGTSSVQTSELCAGRLRGRGISVQVLHARHHAQEAEIVREAGQAGRVTVATNMAGRGTDIKITDEVRAAGGLHVLGTELNRSARIDRQLVGRCARQGDPGSYQFFVSMEDDLLKALGAETHARLMAKAQRRSRTELSAAWVRHFYDAQILLENRDEAERRKMLKQEQSQSKTFHALGLDPHVDLLTDTVF